MKTKTWKSIALMAVTSILLLGLTGCPTGTSSSGSGGGVSGSGTGTGTGSGGSGSGAEGSFDATTGEGAVKGVKFKMIRIAEVTAGIDNNLGHADESNNKPHKASISAYMIGETEVTQELWRAVMGNNPSHHKYNPATGETQTKRPVECVSWYDAIAFCNKLTEKINGNKDECVYYSDASFTTVYESGTDVYMNMDKKGFRLPTEAEWEWAAKGGSENKYAGTNDSNKLHGMTMLKQIGKHTK